MTRLMPQWFPEVWTQLPLPQLGDSDDEGLGGLDRWSFAIVGLEVNGRLRLPATAHRAFAGSGSLWMSMAGEAVLIRSDGTGRAVNIDERGRLCVPCWFRDATGPARLVLVAARTAGDADPVVVLAPPRLLAGFADALVGGR